MNSSFYNGCVIIYCEVKAKLVTTLENYNILQLIGWVGEGIVKNANNLVETINLSAIDKE